MFDDWLIHHGIKGQRWGVRRTAEELGHITESGTKGIDAIKNFSNRKRSRSGESVKNISDEELRKRVNRLNMERQYADLTKNDTSKGFETAKDLLAIIGSVSAITLAGVNLYSSFRYGEDRSSNKNRKDKNTK